MAKTSTARKPTSVHDSNAGHDFHVLWATRRIIELLNPATTLRVVKMEGVAAEDTAKLSATAEHFLAADLTEYHGGEHFAEADTPSLLNSSTAPGTPTTHGLAVGYVSARVLTMLTLLLSDSQLPTRTCWMPGIPKTKFSRRPLHTNLDTLWRVVQTRLRAC